MRFAERLNGIFKGQIEDTTDPLNLGRLRIRVPEIHGTQQNTPTQDLQWCGVCIPAHSFTIPEVGTAVWVMFEKGDVHFPVYMGTMQLLSLGITPKGALPSSPPLPYQAPGNSPPPPLPPDVSIINAQRQAAATVLGVDVNLVPYPAGYGLDAVGQLQNTTNAVLQTEVANVNTLFTAAVNAPDAALNAAMAALVAGLNTANSAAKAAAAIPQMFNSSVQQSLSTINSLQAQLNGLVGAQATVVRAALTNAQAQVTAATGYVSNLVNTLDSLLTQTLAKLQSSVLNLETYFQLPGIQVPQVALAKQSPDPVVRVLLKTPTGHTMAANDDPGNEFLQIIDRVGQILNFDGAVATYANSNNKSQRTGDALHGGAVPITKVVNQRAVITLMDLLGQFLKLDANQPNGVSQAKVILQGVNAQALIIDGTANANKITLQGSGGGFVIIDSTSGDTHVTIEDGSGNNIFINSTGVIVTGPRLQLGDNSATKHLVYLEDLITIFNNHTHPSDGAPPSPPLLMTTNGTSITEAR